MSARPLEQVVFGSDGNNTFRTGHGGNEGMKLHPHVEYRVSILEVAPSSALPDEILLLESRWKERLGRRDFGNLCRN